MATLKAALVEAIKQGGSTFTFPTLVSSAMPLNVPNYSSGSSYITTPVMSSGVLLAPSTNILAQKIENTSVVSQSIFNTLPITGDGSAPTTPFLTLKNGWYLSGNRVSDTYIIIEMHNANGELVKGYTMTGHPTDFLCIVEIDGTDNYDLVEVYKEGIDYRWWVIRSFSQAYTMDFLYGTAPVVYNWTAWDKIAGNDGQYKCNLTMIKDGSIGDFSSEVTGSSNDFDRISAQSDIWGDFQNMNFGDEKILAWSGNAYMTFKITAESQMPDYANFIFKFYSNYDTLLLTHTELVKWNGIDNSVAFYLSFVYDDENQAALFVPIVKMSDGTTYKWGYNNYYDETDMLYLWQWLQMSGAGEDDRPYNTGTTDDGGQPTGDILPNDNMPNVVLPSISAMQTGLFTVYCPSDNDLSNIATYLWSDNVIDNFKKYFNNFSDNLIALYVLPYKPTNLPTKHFKVGGLQSETIDSVEYVTQRFVTIDMGEINVGDVWDSYLDFAPYTRFNIYLPGIGVQAIDADDIMAPLDNNKNFGSKLGSKITLEYALDLMTGICVAYIKINGQIRYQFSGKLGYQIPLTGENYNSILHAFSVASTGLVSTLATGGAAAPFAATSAVTAITNAMKPDVYRGGNLSGNAASLSYPTPYLIRRIPNKPELVDQDKFTGFQSYKSGKLREFGGYTEVIEVHAEGFVCTEEERSEIIELLKKGVIL